MAFQVKSQNTVVQWCLVLAPWARCMVQSQSMGHIGPCTTPRTGIRPWGSVQPLPGKNQALGPYADSTQPGLFSESTVLPPPSPNTPGSCTPNLVRRVTACRALSIQIYREHHRLDETVPGPDLACDLEDEHPRCS